MGFNSAFKGLKFFLKNR